MFVECFFCVAKIQRKWESAKGFQEYTAFLCKKGERRKSEIKQRKRLVFLLSFGLFLLIFAEKEHQLLRLL